ncbi:hypothetical protein [Borreliella garinii]|uniref:hypothetical protein n=1 Tax=Borreliella garinii TaxID=29519 RepID=UPI0003F4D0DB|nr:hypothetical protein [Borreliella garinii]KEO62608.1 hypothetical protein DM10_03805 [Borreliella garinii]WNZ72834.1 hypothetical protein PT143_03350 [Borreliella garinii]
MGITVFYLFSVFTSFVMGSSMESVKENVIKSTIFYYDIEEVEFPYAMKQTLRFIGKTHLKYAVFNFDKNKMFSYTFVFDKKLISQYSIFIEVKKKFGEATLVTPLNYFWDLGEYIIVLNKNILRMTLKSYIENYNK